MDGWWVGGGKEGIQNLPKLYESLAKENRVKAKNLHLQHINHTYKEIHQHHHPNAWNM